MVGLSNLVNPTGRYLVVVITIVVIGLLIHLLAVSLGMDEQLSVVLFLDLPFIIITLVRTFLGMVFSALIKSLHVLGLASAVISSNYLAKIVSFSDLGMFRAGVVYLLYGLVASSWLIVIRGFFPPGNPKGTA